MRKMSPMDAYKHFEHLINTRQIGHGFLHRNMSIKMMNGRLNAEHKRKVSTFTISEDEIIEQMLFAAEDYAEIIANWINNSQESSLPIYFVCEKPIGITVDAEHPEGRAADLLVIGLVRVQDYENLRDSFKITTEYCDVNKHENIKN